MNVKQFLAIVLLILVSLTSCNVNQRKGSNQEVQVIIETEYGTIRAKLYNETPIHRDNFIKKIELGAYNDVIFHRVIQNFMIQGGDPATSDKLKADTAKLNELAKTIPAEIVETLYHKKGALAAARMGDQVNPEKRSSGTQFYIVQGKKFTENELNSMSQQKSQNRMNNLVNTLILQKAEEEIAKGINPNYNKLYGELRDTIDQIMNNMEPFAFSAEQIETYTTLGGTPHLDGDYTVFGEVIDGLEVIDKIAAVKTDNSDKPLQRVAMKIRIVK